MSISPRFELETTLISVLRQVLPVDSCQTIRDVDTYFERVVLKKIGSLLTGVACAFPPGPIWLIELLSDMVVFDITPSSLPFVSRGSLACVLCSYQGRARFGPSDFLHKGFTTLVIPSASRPRCRRYCVTCSCLSRKSDYWGNVRLMATSFL